MNILVVGARIIGVELAKEILRAFLAAEFSKEDRHRRRLGKVMDIERRYTRGGR
jgi:ribose 5-phosphate isomerase B